MRMDVETLQGTTITIMIATNTIINTDHKLKFWTKRFPIIMTIARKTSDYLT